MCPTLDTAPDPVTVGQHLWYDYLQHMEYGVNRGCIGLRTLVLEPSLLSPLQTVTG